MDATGLLTLVLCFVGAYWLISRFFNRANPGAPKPAAPDSVWARERRPASWLDAPVEKRWFDVLGVSQFATATEIRRAYDEKIGAFHPDRVAGLGSELRELAAAKSREINHAYETAMTKWPRPKA